LSDVRFEQLKSWLNTALEQPINNITVASADASFRRYFRVFTAQQTWIAMDAPPEKEDCKPFIQVAEAFIQLGVNVPKIYAQDLDQGFLLLTDFGSTCYLDVLNESNADQLYGDAMQALIDLQTQASPQQVVLPPYDEKLLNQEMLLFSDWFLPKHVKIKLSEAEASELKAVSQYLITNALEQDSVWVHRDYHSRNLMQTTDKNPGVIDFQDAVAGPITYDLVSLLRDCYIAWPAEKIEYWVNAYLEKLQKQGKCTSVSASTFKQWFDLMGVQRHLKAIGIFARLNYRDGKSGYLNDIPRTLNYVKEVSGQYAELTPLHELITKRVLPAMNEL